ncbi:MAG: hypothetical protein LIO79_06860 [Rikenellaceae bacterium]|nr:hypothetical protein [Rikenellaceae bacterium]
MAFLKYLFVITAFLTLYSCTEDGKRTAEDYEVWGIDISRYQKKIDWKEIISGDGPHFIFIKATEGSAIQDPMYHHHKQELEKSGILWGAYHFFGHRTSGKKQARNFINTAKLTKGNLLPVLDIEYHRFLKDRKHLIKEVAAFCSEIKRYYGVYPVIYCSSNFYERYLRRDFPESKYHIWIADYSSTPSASWRFWQHTDSHTIPGIHGNVDRNVFAGELNDLKKFTLR